MPQLCFGESTPRLLYDPYSPKCSHLGRHRDQRNPTAPIRIHTSTHSEDINVLAFHPSTPSLLLSGSADGLLSISNALEDDEDEAVVHVGNWGCSISRAGWSVPAEEIWSHSDMETLATWNNEVGTRFAPLRLSSTGLIESVRFSYCSLTRRMTSGTFAERPQWSGRRIILSICALALATLPANPKLLGTCTAASWPSSQGTTGKFRRSLRVPRAFTHFCAD